MATLNNNTPLAARLLLAETPVAGLRAGCLLAKATYRFGDGGLLLDLLDPHDVLLDDRPLGALGLLPRDDLMGCERHLEVLLLGSAQASRAVSQLRVVLAVGGARRELLVSGERVFMGQGPGAVVSQPEPFLSQPLTWERAFGGRAEVQLDRASTVELAHPLNPAGLGFDPGPQAARLERVLAVAPGYPRWDRRRRLPGVELPGQQVRRWEDTPEPACWAPAPLASQMTAYRLTRPGERPDEGAAPAAAPGLPHAEALHRAHPDWILPRPPAGAPVALEGLTPRGSARFRLPRLRVRCDFRLGARRGQRELAPVRLVLLPDEERFYLVFMHRFTLRHRPGEERVFNLKMDRGWYGAAQDCRAPAGEEVAA